jgi:hypothetical protein
LARIGSLATFQLRIIRSTSKRGGQSVDTDSIGPVNIIIGIPNINTSSGCWRDGGRSGKVGDTGSRSLAGIFTLATFELGIVHYTAIGNGASIDTDSIGPVNIAIGIPGIRSSGSRG